MTLLKFDHAGDTLRLTSEGEISGRIRLTPRQADRLGRELQDWAKRRISRTAASAAKRASAARKMNRAAR